MSVLQHALPWLLTSLFCLFLRTSVAPKCCSFAYLVEYRPLIIRTDKKWHDFGAIKGNLYAFLRDHAWKQFKA